jgi:hypothetical protein
MERRDAEAADEARRAAERPVRVPDREPTEAERAEWTAWRLAVEVHGSPEAAHQAWVASEVRRRAAEAHLACRFCGSQAVTYTPREPVFTHPHNHPMRGLPIEPYGHGADADRFSVTVASCRSALCAEHQEHAERGDLDSAVARVLLTFAGQDGDDAFDPVLAEAIARRVPIYEGRASDALWTVLGKSKERVSACQAIVAEARAEVATIGPCERCGTHALLTTVTRTALYGAGRYCPGCLAVFRRAS